ncbi:hypothetical protein NL327_31725, partial [Klebsiella pneumoniae]|nr:hypothetical protein [Klebsiella pneumoniae]
KTIILKIIYIYQIRDLPMRNLLFFKKLPLIIALSMGLMACNDSDNDPSETSPVTTPSASVALQVFDNTTGSQINNAQVSI